GIIENAAKRFRESEKTSAELAFTKRVIECDRQASIIKTHSPSASVFRCPTANNSESTNSALFYYFNKALKAPPEH
nr:hypothetical protein [Vampirovibrio sp.]